MTVLKCATDWPEKWLDMQFSVNPQHRYQMTGRELMEVDKEKDLGL